MELFVEHLPGFGAQRRKALMHAGLHAQGSHYLLYDYSTAAEALREVGRTGLTPRLRREVREAILTDLDAVRSLDQDLILRAMVELIDATVRTYDFAAWFQRVQEGRFDLSMGWSFEGPTPYLFYRWLMSSEMPASMCWQRPANRRHRYSGSAIRIGGAAAPSTIIWWIFLPHWYQT